MSPENLTLVCKQFLSAVRSIRFVSSAVRSTEFSEVNTMLKNFVFCVSPRIVNYNCQKLKNDVEIKFLGSCLALTYNVFAVYFSLEFETLSTETLLTKIIA